MKYHKGVKHRIRISAGSVTALAELNSTSTAVALWQVLPLNARANTWGDEVYFDIPLKLDIEDGKEIVEIGDIGYWPPGHAVCIFFGSTPVSGEGEIRPASAVTILGKLIDDPKAFRKVKQGNVITVERA